MSLADVRLTTLTNVKILAVSAALIVVGGVASTVPVYGWLLSMVFGLTALFSSLYLQQTELRKTFRIVLEDSIAERMEVAVIPAREESGDSSPDD